MEGRKVQRKVARRRGCCIGGIDGRFEESEIQWREDGYRKVARWRVHCIGGWSDGKFSPEIEFAELKS